ncbi:MAG: UV DNA damage repair endonuclease UvsE [Kiritimatiellia bacterium]
MRLGLCCQFKEVPIRFRTTTAAAMQRLGRAEALGRLSALCLANAEALLDTVAYCAEQGIGAFRINSQILPLRTHPAVGYGVRELPGAHAIVARFRAVGKKVAASDIRLSFHPDQFVLLSSPHEHVTEKSLAELDYQAEVAEWVGADVINIHGGGAYGDKQEALDRLARNLARLPDRVRTRLTLENDDVVYTPADLLPLCRREGVPLVYDVHHHRCRPDDCTVEVASELAASTWNREPLFHISSPLEGWHGPKPRRHHDYIDPADVPPGWVGQAITVDIEAKAKEQAVLRLAAWLKAGRA